MAIDPILDEKLRELIDRDAIWQVQQRYGRAMDRLDRELLQTCYFQDAIDDHGSFVGSPGDFADWAFDGASHFVSQHHAILNHHCEIDGDDAYAETYFQCANIASEPPHLLALGRYIDHFQRRGGEWRIANRIAIVEKTFELLESSKWPRIAAPLATAAAHPVKRDRDDVSYHRPPIPRRP